jgi:hypothetical protein
MAVDLLSKPRLHLLSYALHDNHNYKLRVTATEWIVSETAWHKAEGSQMRQCIH